MLGISTARVGLGSTGSFVGINSTNANVNTLYFTGIGTGLYHSFKTNYENVLIGKVEKSLVTVSTASTHGLTNKDSVFLNVLPGITTTVKVAYNDYNRRLVINPRTFASGDVDVSTNTITIPRHGYSNGQKVIYTASTASGGLFNNGIYFAYVVDLDSIKLCNESVSYTHLRAHETRHDLVCRLLL